MAAQAHERDPEGARLAAALALVVSFMAVELAVGIVAHSLALMSDAAHMVADAGALALALVALRLAARPIGVDAAREGSPPDGSSKARDQNLTYGLKRAEILSALLNGTTLAVLAVFIVYEAVRRLASPANVHGWPMLAVALAGMLLNVVVGVLLFGSARTNLNLRGAFQHALADLYAFAGTAVAAVVIIASGFDRADPIASLVVAAIIIWTSYGLVRAAVRVLLEAAPAGADIGEIGTTLARHPAVTGVHDLHVWEITSGFPALSAHVLVRPDRDCHKVRRELEVELESRFAIGHTTLQVDHDRTEVPITITRPATAGPVASSARRGNTGSEQHEE